MKNTKPLISCRLKTIRITLRASVVINTAATDWAATFCAVFRSPFPTAWATRAVVPMLKASTTATEKENLVAKAHGSQGEQCQGCQP